MRKLQIVVGVDPNSRDPIIFPVWGLTYNYDTALFILRISGWEEYSFIIDAGRIHPEDTVKTMLDRPMPTPEPQTINPIKGESHTFYLGCFLSFQ